MALENTSAERIDSILAAQKAFFATGTTRDVKWRRQQLAAFAKAMVKWEKPLTDALWTDLHKSYEESYLTEIGLVKAEIRTAHRNVAKWARKELRPTAVACMPASTWIVKEPLGTALIVSPWNYPVQLLLSPLVGAIAAGCTAVLKPSPYVPTVSKVIEELMRDTFAEEYIAVVQGNRDVNKKLFDCRWDLIFFTGSPALAHSVMEAAAKNLTPVVLELGGKSPCIIDKSCDVKLAARRVAWGKTLNSGQTCIAPDYILIHKDVKDAFVAAFAEQMQSLHGADIKDDRHYVRMVSDKAFDRVSSYIGEGDILYGGRTDRAERFIEPTLIENVKPDAAVLRDEIFGPVFPVITLDDSNGTSFADKVVDYVVSREKPLAFYYFGREKDGWSIIGRTSSGGGCINDTIMHIVNGNVPFGGVGNSGMGSYHHKESFLAFTHRRSIVASATFIDLPFKYMPYGLFKMVKHLL